MAATSRTKASFADVPDDYVPRTNDDLYRTYASFVARLVTRYNRVTSNYEDLLQHVWYKLIEVDVIGKYNASGGSLPKKLTALQACSHLQITWIQFKKILHRHRVGDNRHTDRVRGVADELRDRVFERDHGVCACCGSNMHEFQEKMEFGRLNPDLHHTNKHNGKQYTHAELIKLLGISPKQRIFWYAEKVGKIKRGGDHLPAYQTICFRCWNKKSDGVQKSKSEWAPAPIEGTWASKKAMYAREDIERLKMMREGRKDRCKKHVDIDPLVFHTKSFFKLYLARSVHNIYANWCRTRDRRYKEHFPGIDAESGKSWEETLEDPTGPRQENLLAVYEAAKVIAYGDRDGGGESKVHEEVLALAAEGHTLAEIVQKLSLPKTALKALQGG